MVVATRLVAPRLFFFFFNDTATTEIYTLSLHDALPISRDERVRGHHHPARLGRSRAADRQGGARGRHAGGHRRSPQRDRLDRKSTRLNSSHLVISYAVFCLKKKRTG